MGLFKTGINLRNTFAYKMVSIFKNLFGQEKVKSEEEEILEAVQKALDDIRNSEIFFHSVTDMNLIDYAIYKINAAQEKYGFLIKLAKEKQVRAKWEIIR